ncbi:MAG: sulfotransferase family protein [Caldilinea sp.]
MNLAPTALMAQAEEATGLSDWGTVEVYEPLQRFWQALHHEASLTPAGTQVFQQESVRLLANRLLLEAEFARLPSGALVPLTAPLFVVGLFRSGTSLLHNLLAQDPAARWLHLAEALYPVPAPVAAHWPADPRLEQASALIHFQNGLAADFVRAHHIAANKPAECSRLFEHSWIGHLFDFRASVPSYADWLLHQPLRAPYRDYHRQLQYLSLAWPPESHWVLKAPAHLYALETLVAEFPSARIVYLHRDPQEVLPSCCSLTAAGRRRFSDRIDPAAIGAYWLARLGALARRASAPRAAIPPAQILDVHYRELVANPLQTVYTIYEYFGYRWNAGLASNLSQWFAQNPQHQHGVHRYTLEQFGLVESQVTEAFEAR